MDEVEERLAVIQLKERRYKEDQLIALRQAERTAMAAHFSMLRFDAVLKTAIERLQNAVVAAEKAAEVLKAARTTGIPAPSLRDPLAMCNNAGLGPRCFAAST